MIGRTEISSRFVSGLRTRFRPKNRIGQGLLTVAPWLDLVMIALFLVMLQGKYVMEPGVVVNLPAGPFSGGLQSGRIAVVLSVGGGAHSAAEEIVVFNDRRFRLKNDMEAGLLTEAFESMARDDPASGLILQADKYVQHGTIVRILQMAGGAGVRQVNIATRESAENGLRPGGGG